MGRRGTNVRACFWREVMGHSVRSQAALAQKYRGLCTQFDRLFDFLNAEETLEIFAQLKGVVPEALAQAKEAAIEAVGLKTKGKTLAGKSQGSHRALVRPNGRKSLR